MFKSSSGKKATSIIIGLAACWFVSPKCLTAQSAPRVLVVVADRSDAECVRRIGGEHVHVELLFASEAGVLPSNYLACDKRVRGLLEFELFVYRSDCPSEALWRERMAAANPRGKVLRLSQSRCGEAFDSECRIQRASEIHVSLAAILPEHRASLDANLKAELHRLRSARFDSLQLALGG
jgi:ABC-type Zn uptake system ZnuABC Zn-binding protein ZnuA